LIKRITIGDLRLTFTAARIVKVGGFNSLLTDGNHILMWDFDNVDLRVVRQQLASIQMEYSLPKISILETRKHTNFIAYCFKRLPWRAVVAIVCQAPDVDFNFFKYSVYRERFTLRVTDKGYGLPHCVAVLESKIPEDATILDLASWVNYETLKKKKVVKGEEPWE